MIDFNFHDCPVGLMRVRRPADISIGFYAFSSYKRNISAIQSHFASALEYTYKAATDPAVGT